MGHRASALAALRCCQEDSLPQGWNPEYFTEDIDPEQLTPSGARSREAALRGMGTTYPDPFQDDSPDSMGGESAASRPVRIDPRWGCCKAGDTVEGGFQEFGTASPHPLEFESLSYNPVRFDEGTTIDVERSHARYSKIVVHSTRARTQRRSKVWEDWIRSATAGRSITLFCGLGEAAVECHRHTLDRIPATYFLDRGLSKLLIQPATGIDMAAITVIIDNIQVICPATDFMIFLDQVDKKLNNSEKSCAVLLQYVTEDTERKRVCFLEESEGAKNSFVQALTSLWLEKRNDHSMWF